MGNRTLGLYCVILIIVGAGCGQSTGSKPLVSSRAGHHENWTILCREFTGANHQEYCEQFADSLRRTPEINSQLVRTQINSQQGNSRLYYGKYVRRFNSRTGKLDSPPELLRDIAMIQDLGDDTKRHYFLYARMVPYSGRASEGPTEWDLKNTTTGKYTLQVAVFYPERGFSEVREAAISYTKALRKSGLEAYYYHGPVKSIVTVGLFGESAVVEQTGSSDGSTEVRGLKYSAEVRRLQRRSECKYNYENGHKKTRIVQGQRREPYSFLVLIPRNEDDLYRSTWRVDYSE